MGIDYRLRTHKHIERQLLLSFIKDYIGDKSAEYKYLGFGAEYYKDFVLMHEGADINKMTSIEKNTSRKARFEFNKPYKCIDLEFGTAKDFIIATSFDDKMIVWLDFTATFSEEILEETILLINSIKQESIILFTYNIERPIETEEYSVVFNEFLPIDYNTRYHSKREYPKLVKKTLDIIVKKYLTERKMEFIPFFDFKYADSAKMQTIGYIIDNGEVIQKLISRWKNNVFFFTEGGYELKIETLTPKELLYLKSEMPVLDCIDLILPWCNKKTDSDTLIKQFKDIYKYYPLYGETIT